MAGATKSSRTTATVVLAKLELAVRLLAVVLALTLLVVGTIAVIAELKGTWHWAIHLESTITYLGRFVTILLVPLVPGFLALVVGRRVFHDA